MNATKDIGPVIKRLTNEIGRCLSGDDAEGITRMQRWIIGYVYNHEEGKDVFQKDLEESFNIRRSTATGILQLMEKNGLILRQNVPYDQRLKKIILTPKAIMLYKEARAKVECIEAKLRENIEPAEVELFMKTAEKMCINLKSL